MAQDPGPRGSPHEPQAPDRDAGASCPEDSLTPPTAKVENSFSRSTLPQPGQTGRASPKTSASKRREHFRQTYSNMGMNNSSRDRPGDGEVTMLAPRPRRFPGPPGLRAQRAARSDRRRAPSGSAAR